jgi:hypothetical protein
VLPPSIKLHKGIPDEVSGIMAELAIVEQVEQTEIEITHILRWEDDGGYLPQHTDGSETSISRSAPYLMPLPL